MTKLSVVIVNWNTNNLLAACLDSLQMALNTLDGEVFVVDNASIDQSPQMVAAEYPWVKLVQNEANAGFAAANNQVFGRCKGEYVLLLNPDTKVLGGAIAKLVNRLDCNPQVGVVAPKIVHERGRLRVLSAGSQPSPSTAFNQYFMLSSVFKATPRFRGINLIAGEHDDRIRAVEWVSAACMLVRRSIITDVGGFSTRWFMYGEDMEWCYRIARAGWILEHVPAACVVHSLGAASEQNPKVSTMWVRSMRSWYVERADPSFSQLAAFDAAVSLGLGTRAGYYLLRSLAAGKHSRMWFHEALGFIRAAGAVLDERKKPARRTPSVSTSNTKTSLDLKSQIKQVLRKTNTLQAADRALFAIHWLKSSPCNYRFHRQNPNVKTPPAALCFDAYGHVRADWYYLSGRETAEIIAELINRHLLVGTDKPAILDWGCGSARVVRHLGDYLSSDAAVWGADYNSRAISWSRNTIPGISFSENQLTPPLDFKDETFDAIYGISVFTHLSEAMHYEWRDELLRVLKPGGILVLTLNGDYWKQAHLLQSEKLTYEDGKLLVHSHVEEGKKWFLAYQSPAFVRRHFLNEMDILEHIKGPLFPHMKQEVWVARKKTG